MQCKYYQILLGWTCEWSLWRGGRFKEVVFKTGSTAFCNRKRRLKVRSGIYKLPSRHYPRAIWTLFYQFWACNLGAQIKDLYAYMWKKKVKFFVNYDKWSQQSRNFNHEALKIV